MYKHVKTIIYKRLYEELKCNQVLEIWVLKCVMNKWLNENEIMKRKNDGKDGWIENYKNEMSYITKPNRT